ncbi:unnamed protein product, partial [Allacma fusca]
MFFILFWTGFIFQPAAVFGNENQKKIPIVAGLPNDNEILRFSPAWLNELEESYRIGFAKQFRSIQYRNRSTPINPNIPASQESWCRNVSFLSVEQNKRLIHKYGYNSVLNSTINEMLENPRAWLFDQEDHSGNMEDYNQVLPKYEYLGNTRMNLTEVLMHHRISQIIESFSGNESKRNFNQQAETPLPSLRRCKHLSIIEKQLKENTTETLQFTSMTAFIQEMIQKPMVRLFAGENFT